MLLGFSNQNILKRYLGAKDIEPIIDYNYIDKLNTRLRDIIKSINNVIYSDFKIANIDDFFDDVVLKTYETLKENNKLDQFNNQGRSKEEVYFSWMRGFVVLSYFEKFLIEIFQIDDNSISKIGDDNINDMDSFQRTPKADIQIKLKTGQIIRVEVQSGFQGINDIKEHKVREAINLKRETGINTILIHFDILNGQVAFVNISNIESNDQNWITRQQMEGQTVFNIEQNYFSWKLIEKAPLFEDIDNLDI